MGIPRRTDHRCCGVRGEFGARVGAARHGKGLPGLSVDRTGDGEANERVGGIFDTRCRAPSKVCLRVDINPCNILKKIMILFYS